MFRSMKMELKSKVEENTELARIQAKLHKFLTNNADIDAYLSDRSSAKSFKSFLIGLIYGVIIGLIVFGIIALYYLNVWHAEGWIHLPNTLYWK